VTETGGVNYGGATQSFATVIGKHYTIAVDLKKGTHNADFVIGTSLGASDIYNHPDLRVNSTAAASTAYFDNITCKQIAPAIERTYLAKVITNSDGEVISIDNFPVAKQDFGDVEVQNDLVVHGDIENLGVCTAWVIFDATVNPLLILDSYNVKDAIDLAVGKYRIVFEESMDTPRFSMTGGAGISEGAGTDFSIGSPTVNGCSMRATNSANTLTDYAYTCVTIFGGKEIK